MAAVHLHFYIAAALLEFARFTLSSRLRLASDRQALPCGRGSAPARWLYFIKGQSDRTIRVGTNNTRSHNGGLLLCIELCTSLDTPLLLLCSLCRRPSLSIRLELKVQTMDNLTLDFIGAQRGADINLYRGQQASPVITHPYCNVLVTVISTAVFFYFSFFTV